MSSLLHMVLRTVRFITIIFFSVTILRLEVSLCMNVASHSGGSVGHELPFRDWPSIPETAKPGICQRMGLWAPKRLIMGLDDVPSPQLYTHGS
jgi:hypothetical protein